MDLLAFGCGRLRPQGGYHRRGTARLLRAAEMRPKTSGSEAGGSVAGGGGGGGCCVGGGSLWRRWCSWRASLWMGARRRLTGVASGGCSGGERVGCPPLPVGLVPRSLPSPSQPGGQVWGVSGVCSPRAPGPRGACAQRLGGGGGACTRETPGGPRLGGLGRRGGPGRARRTAPPPQRGRPSAPVLGHEHLAAWCDRGRGPRATQARRGFGVPLVSGTAPAADAPAQASAPWARWCPMLQAECALSATARSRRAAALRSR